MKVDARTVAVVTGATGGIGAAIVDAMRARGAIVVSTDVAGAVTPSGAGPDVTLDVRDLAATRQVISDLVGNYGRLDVAVACAGIATGGLVEELGDEAIASVIDVNLVGAIHTLRASYAHMIAAQKGHLVAIASLAGLLPAPLLAPYSATKTGLVGFMGSLRPEARRHGIGTTVVCPGPVDTRMLDDGGAHGTIVDIDARRLLTNAAGPAIPASEVGDAVLRGIERNVALVTPGRARALYLAARLTPGVTAKVIERSMRQELKHRH